MGDPAPPPPLTPSQTIGPFWHLLADPAWADLTRSGAQGEVIEVSGILRDGDGAPVTDACIELWQADPPADERFAGFGRCATDGQGRFRFRTIKPGPVRGQGNATQAPHLAIHIFARGLLHHLSTRIYFAGDALNENDPVLSSIDEKRRHTLIAGDEGGGRWSLDIHLQGDAETVFLAC